MEHVLIRELTEDDEPFIYNSWLRSYSQADHVAHVPNSLYTRYQVPVIRKLLKDCQVKLIVDREEPHVIFAWICFDGPTLHYVYTKKSFRGFGFCKRLITACMPERLHISHATQFAKFVTKYGFTFNPKILDEVFHAIEVS